MVLTNWLIIRLSERLTLQFTDYLTDGSNDKVTDDKAEWMTDFAIPWLTDWLTDGGIAKLTDYKVEWMTDLAMHWLTDWLFARLAEWLADQLTDRLAGLAGWQWLKEWLECWRLTERNWTPDSLHSTPLLAGWDACGWVAGYRSDWLATTGKTGLLITDRATNKLKTG